MNKQQLLDLGIFVDNEFLDLYVLLINNNYNTKKQAFKTQRHHIIPKYYYKSQNINVDNSDSNMVNLLYKDHILAHYYLSLCSDNQFCYYNYLAIQYCINHLHLDESMSEDLNSFLLELDHIQEIYEISRKFHSECLRGKKRVWSDIHKINQKAANGIRGKTLYHYGNEQRWFVKGTQPEGYELGASEKYKQRLSERRSGEFNSNYGKHWSEEWKTQHSLQTKGRKDTEQSRYKKSKAHLGMKWIVNSNGETSQIHGDEDLPYGYIYGRKYTI